MTTKTITAGQRLRADLDQALEHASRSLGRRLEWCEVEAHTIEQAVLVADRGEEIRALIRAELESTEPRPSLVVKLSAEARLCERQAVDLVARVNPGLGQAKSPQYMRAVDTRWHPSQRA